jgi:heme A synthase
MPEVLDKYDQQSVSRFRNLLLVTAVMVYLLIVIGGIVRVTGSGLGCPDWPRCFGQWIPPMRQDAIIEYTHRLVATLTSPLILASSVVAWWRFRSLRLGSSPLLLAALLLAVQGLLGGVVVLLETPPNLVAVHLVIAFIIQSLIVFPLVLMSLSKRINLETAKLSFSKPFSRQVLYLLLAIFLMIVSGALVVGSNSTYACSGWPLCNGQLIPSNPMGLLHMLHRTMVLLASILLLRVYLLSTSKTNLPEPYQKWLKVLVWLFLAQALVGALKVSFAFPVWLLGLHVALAAAVWVSAVVFSSLVVLTES